MYGLFMKLHNLSLILILLLLSAHNFNCAGSNISAKKDENSHEYINSTANLNISKEKLGESPAYEVYFTLDRTVDCIGISLETSSVPKRTWGETIPVKSYFLVEKIIDLKTGGDKKRRFNIQLGQNYNSDWKTHNPIKICVNSADPVSRLDNSLFRVRFTTFDTGVIYFSLIIHTPAGVLFSATPYEQTR